ncbi:MAG: AraC family transcriptional regulator [Candidatus Cryptobacteroides sp.]
MSVLWHQIDCRAPNHFSRLFKKVTGLTPSEFLK